MGVRRFMATLQEFSDSYLNFVAYEPEKTRNVTHHIPRSPFTELQSPLVDAVDEAIWPHLL